MPSGCQAAIAAGGELLDQLGAAVGAVVGRTPGGDLAGAGGEAWIAEDAAGGPAQRAGPTEAPRQRAADARPGDPHRGLAHVAGDRRDQHRSARPERPGDGPVATV